MFSLAIVNKYSKYLDFRSYRPSHSIQIASAMAPKRKSDTIPRDQPSNKKASSGKSTLDSVSSITSSLTTNDERTVSLSELAAEQGLVVFLYPRANTPGCTKQACGFRDNYDEFQECGFDVWGMSYDKPKSQTNWQTKYKLPYGMLTDADGTVIRALGAHKAPKSILRSHVVVAQGGKVIDIQNGISPADSFTKALETVKKNSQKKPT